MEKQLSPSQKLFIVIGSVMGWFALLLQLYLIIVNRTASLPETIIRYFSFYTIQSNILVALCFTVLLLKPESGLGKFFSKVTIRSAITVYITIVGIVYNVILRFLWAPTGWQKVADELLHLVIPLFFILYWMLFVPKEPLKWTDFFPWLIFPFLYCIYTLIRGSYAHYYPYPFMDADTLGLKTVLFNSLILTVAFSVMSLILIGIAKLSHKKSA